MTLGLAKFAKAVSSLRAELLPAELGASAVVSWCTLRWEKASTEVWVGDLVIASPKTLISSSSEEGGVGCIDSRMSSVVSSAVGIG